MRDFRIVTLVLLVAALWGCPPKTKQNDLSQPSASAADFIEYTKIDNWGKIRVLISAIGAARIDIELDHHSTSYVLAVSVPEAERLIRSGEGLIQTLQSTEPIQGIAVFGSTPRRSESN